MPNPTPTTGILVTRPKTKVFQPCSKKEIPDTLKLLSRQHKGIFTTADGVTAEFVAHDSETSTHEVLEAIDLVKAGYRKAEEAPVTP